jgi:hypothetical protein
VLEGDAFLAEERKGLGHRLVNVDKDLLTVRLQFGLVEALEVDDLRRRERWISFHSRAKLGAKPWELSRRTFICFCRQGMVGQRRWNRTVTEMIVRGWSTFRLTRGLEEEEKENNERLANTREGETEAYRAAASVGERGSQRLQKNALEPSCSPLLDGSAASPRPEASCLCSWIGASPPHSLVVQLLLLLLLRSL